MCPAREGEKLWGNARRGSERDEDGGDPGTTENAGGSKEPAAESAPCGRWQLSLVVEQLKF